MALLNEIISVVLSNFIAVSCLGMAGYMIQHDHKGWLWFVILSFIFVRPIQSEYPKKSP